jgi:CHASE2 domain-containing sensor protein
VATTKGRDVPSVTGLLEFFGVPHHVATHRRTEALVAALFFASATFLLVPTGILDWMDIAMLNIVPSIRGVDLFSLGSYAEPVDIAAVTIGSRFFERDFQGRTPIPRAPFAKLLACVVKRFQPQVLAVDYDLSPGTDELERLRTPSAPEEPPTTDELCTGTADVADPMGGRRLDAYLASLARPSPPNSPPVKVVLIRPLALDDPTICETRLAWEEQMRGRGVAFGDSDLVHHRLFGIVVKFENVAPAFARQVYCAHRPSRDCSETCIPKGCAKCLTAEESRLREVRREDLRPIHFLRAERLVRPFDLAGFGAVSAQAERHGRAVPVVFVGAAYDPSDVFMTPVGQKAGVLLHAYSAFSMDETKGLKEKHGLAFLIDVVIGTVVGVALARTWGPRYASEGRAMRVRRALLSLLVVGGAASVLSLVFARSLMSLGVWLNPGPMLAAFFIHSWHTSATAHARTRRSHSGDNPAETAVAVTREIEMTTLPRMRLRLSRLVIWRRANRRKDSGVWDHLAGTGLCLLWLGVVASAVFTMLFISH